MTASKEQPIIHAYSWASGRIDFTTPKRRRTIPQGALHIASGPQRQLKACMRVIARHGYGKSTGVLLVPGVPEASLLKRDPLKALKEFREQARRHLWSQWPTWPKSNARHHRPSSPKQGNL